MYVCVCVCVCMCVYVCVCMCVYMCDEANLSFTVVNKLATVINWLWWNVRRAYPIYYGPYRPLAGDRVTPPMYKVGSGEGCVRICPLASQRWVDPLPCQVYQIVRDDGD